MRIAGADYGSRQAAQEERNEPAKNALTIEKFTVESPAFSSRINNQQDIRQRLLKDRIDADFETLAWMLRNIMTPY